MEKHIIHNKKKNPWYIPKPCMNPEHNPPQYKVFEPGAHIHTCPGCGKEQVVNIPHIIW